MGELKDGEVRVDVTDNLHSHRETASIESDWHADSGTSEQGYNRTRFHPPMVGVHRMTFDFLRPVHLCVEREDLCRRQQQIVKVIEQSIYRLIPGGSYLRCPENIASTQAKTALNFPLQFGLELGTFRMIGVQITEAARDQPMT